LNGVILKIELVVSDDCLIPQLSVIPQSSTEAGQIRVLIGIQHDFDDILDICAGNLSNEEIAHIHRLWSDDEFPRNFRREGANLIITSRDD
jgi:hypothetical protein